jgi:hypothetical protein
VIKIWTAHTSEVDDAAEAVSEIMEQLDIDGKLEGKLLKNTVGLLTCYADFIESEAVKRICEALPFEVVGSTTLGNAVPRSSSTILLTLMLISSDDVYFSVGLTDPIPSEDPAPLRRAYETAAAKLAEKPVLMLSYAPLLMNVGGDFFANSFTEISGGVPNFGMLAVDHNSDYHESQIICNGEAYLDRYTFVLLSGNIHPRFITGSISNEKVSREKGLVTAAQGNQLQTINGKPVVEYLQSIGITRNKDGTIVGINSFPFIVDYNDGTTPIVLAMFANTPEGYAVCGGNIPVGAILSVGSINAEEVLTTTAETLVSAIGLEEVRGILMFSCVGRYFSLGYQPMAEIEKVQELLKDTDIPYQFTYSGGELCPVYSREKGISVTANRNHNDTFVGCVF